MRLLKKSLSKINLSDLLRRKKSTLDKFLSESGIVTYDKLVERCNSIGVVPPPEESFNKAMGNPATPELSSPMDGIVVLEPILGEDETEALTAPEGHVDNSTDETLKPSRQKKKRKSETTEGI